MKNVFVALAVCVLWTANLGADSVSRFRLRGGVGYFIPQERLVKDIYGKSIFFDVGCEYLLSEKLSTWGSVSYMTRTGSMTGADDSTDMTVIPILAGIKYRLVSGELMSLYCGGGVGFFSFKESNYIGTASEFKFGYQLKAGAMFPLSDKTAIDIETRYEYCKVGSHKVNIGGLKMSLGFNIDI